MTNIYKNGVWGWDDISNGVQYLSKEVLQRNPSRISRISGGTMSISGRTKIQSDIRMIDSIDAYTQKKFKRHYQRKVKFSDVDVATIQDVKDVAIFTTKVDDLFPEFISFFHTVAMDRFLRSIIVYFQYYLQVWGKMQLRRKEQTRKLTQPIVTELENEVRDNLADLRSMVSRDYAAILMGIDDAKEFHHMNNKNADSLSDKDRRLFETTIFMVTKVVWIALFRKHLSLIEKEVNRLLRTFNFSPIEHSQKSLPSSTPQEDRVLFGKAFRIEKRLLHRSPAIQEIIFDDHDYRLLSIGINNIPNADERIRYLEITYAAPETLLVENDIAVGVLGVRRKYLDPMLKPKDISTTVKRTSLMKIGNFKIPPKSPSKDKLISDVLPSTPCRYQETSMTTEVRAAQCKMWRKYLQMGGVLLSELEEAESVRTLRTSICPSSTNI